MGRPQEGESPWSLRETTEERPASPPPSLFCTSILDDDIICPPPAEESDSSPPRSPVEGALRETCLDGALRETWGTIEKHKATLLRKKHEKRKPPRKAREVVTLAREAATPAATAEPGAAPDAEASRRDLLQERTRQSVLARSLKEEIGDALYQQCEKSFYSRTVTRIVLSGDLGADRGYTFVVEVCPLAGFAILLAFLQTWSLQTTHQSLVRRRPRSLASRKVAHAGTSGMSSTARWPRRRASRPGSWNTPSPTASPGPWPTASSTTASASVLKTPFFRQSAYSSSPRLDDSVVTRGLPIYVIAPLVFTTFMLGNAVQSGVSGMKTAYIVIRWGMRRERLRPRWSKLGCARRRRPFSPARASRFPASSPRSAWRAGAHRPRLVPPHRALHHDRVRPPGAPLRRGERSGRLWRAKRYFVQITIMIVGTADGPFNLLLNSLAMFFILECDDIIDFDKPDSGYFGSLRLAIWQQHVAWQAQVQDILGDVADRVQTRAQRSSVVARFYTSWERLMHPMISVATRAGKGCGSGQLQRLLSRSSSTCFGCFVDEGSSP